MGRTQSLNRPLFLRTNLLWVITWWPGYFIKPWNDIFENCACISDHSLFQWFSNFMEEIYSVPVLISSCACRSWHVWTMAASRILGPLLQRSVADYFDVSSQEPWRCIFAVKCDCCMQLVEFCWCIGFRYILLLWISRASGGRSSQQWVASHEKAMSTNLLWNPCLGMVEFVTANHYFLLFLEHK